MTDTAHTPTKNQDFRADPAFEATRALLRAAQRIAVMSGAGMSAESGVPTFRDAQTGLWSNCRPEDLADERAYRQRPGWVWDWYMHRREQLKTVKPNAGHIALAEFQQRHPQRLTLMTQNVDRLHQAAGSTGVLELHGNWVDDRWLDPCPKTPACPVSRAAPGSPPRCPECGHLLRPDIVWFGDSLPAQVLAEAERASLAFQVMLVIGTSGVVYPAAGLPIAAQHMGAAVIIINPAPTELDRIARHLLRYPSAQVLPALLDDI